MRTKPLKSDPKEVGDDISKLGWAETWDWKLSEARKEPAMSRYILFVTPLCRQLALMSNQNKLNHWFVLLIW